MSLVQMFLIALIALIITGVGAAFFMNREAERQKRMVSVVKGRAALTGNAAPSEQDAQNKRRADIARKLKENKEDNGNSNKPEPPPGQDDNNGNSYGNENDGSGMDITPTSPGAGGSD